jgi:hypothetical protein
MPLYQGWVRHRAPVISHNGSSEPACSTDSMSTGLKGPSVEARTAVFVHSRIFDHLNHPEVV